MNPVTVQALWTIAAFAIFVGIAAWAWSRRAARGFEDATRLPFADDGPDAAENVGRGEVR